MRYIFLQVLVITLNLSLVKAQTTNPEFIPVLKAILIDDDYYLRIASTSEDSLQVFIFASKALQKNDEAYQLAKFAPHGRYFVINNCNVDLFKSWIAFPNYGQMFLVISDFKNNIEKARVVMFTSTIVYQSHLNDKYLKTKYLLTNVNGNWIVKRKKKKQIECCHNLE